ncbi:hypothetical protein [Agriterribacter sp.]|uniref:hypothetical protein n=1 Tax=Agriterribacter sp. TaxID=2821509 RepID=UPI002D0D8570|nr:hypothetical protein [Agriterribacter sp.]HRP55846.1 hypothetical protein [Agriterribacter sp.]
MKSFTTILLFTIIFLQTFSSFVIRADYFINKSYIARVLCINKEKPQTHCNGKCYLTKQLDQQEKQDQQAPVPKWEKFDMQPFFLPKDLDFLNDRLLVTTEYPIENEMLTFSFPRSIFHPPSA